ncbi:hypothetical protein B0H11DRAFT_1927170 [Mycena galericulata]|nr:hypothetical protein B0H11DRAFT_1927170 [Mycena galericulata]
MFLPLAHWSPRRLELWETSHPAHIVGHRKSHPSPRRRAGFAPDARDGGIESPSPGKEGRIGNEMKDEWKRGECRPLGGGVMVLYVGRLVFVNWCMFGGKMGSSRVGKGEDVWSLRRPPARACSERGIRLSHSTGTSMRNRHVYLGTRWHVRVDVEDQLFEARPITERSAACAEVEREKHTQIAGRLNGEGELEPVQRRSGGGQASVQTIRVQSQHEYERAERGRRVSAEDVHGVRERRAVREDKWLERKRAGETQDRRGSEVSWFGAAELEFELLEHG